ncbi:M20 aminoacylase family protein [Klebsiella pneumoniae]|uniref:M20 aminoacylase family protein n=1 Tax=Klebsiella pneumoniae TaxID=573 RepID=UPI001CE2068F|nr:M20 aminoacylase family protein [Klebsiella pneumoniae]MCA5498675.1 M20 family metallopeptidase [Klebsiella pneumoniae]MCA5509506.1 M20 family metallopeptidase [Klebsiella pneumoniae]HDK9860805.1 amidohydrolase [Klebsiella pneumoniae]
MVLTIHPGIKKIESEMIAIRHHIHAYPELGFEEFSTSDLVANLLGSWGYTVHRGLGGTGVVGQICRGEGYRIGLRAEMDALPLQEKTALSYQSTIPGKMHACGHDGHTAILLAAAKILASEPQFNGTLNVIFQPAEEGKGGAQKMVDDGLFTLFPCDGVYAMHNMPGLPLGKLGFLSGPFMASSDTVSMTIQGHGGHAAVPHKTVDPLVIAANIVLSMQTIVSRNINPLDMAIVSVGEMHAGSAANIVPDTAEIVVSVRALNSQTRDRLQERIITLSQAITEAYSGTITIDYHRRYPVLCNHDKETKLARDVAISTFGEDCLIPDMVPSTGSEDFAFMLEACPGSYLLIGNGDNGDDIMPHHPKYDFNDTCISVGASYWIALVNTLLS